MRARQRHFNPAHAGFQLVLDSRFLPLNNNDLVSTWTGRTRTNLSPDTSGGTRPTYLTNILNGNPAIRFGGSHYLLNTTESFSGPRTVFAVSANRRSSLLSSTLDPSFGVGWAGNSGVGWFEATSYNWFTNTTQRRVAYGSSNRKNGGTSVNLELNEYFIGSGYSSQTVTVAGFIIGATRTNNGGISFISISDILFVAVIKSQISVELTKRLEHSSAFSFKISCN